MFTTPRRARAGERRSRRPRAELGLSWDGWTRAEFRRRRGTRPGVEAGAWLVNDSTRPSACRRGTRTSRWRAQAFFGIFRRAKLCGDLTVLVPAAITYFCLASAKPLIHARWTDQENELRPKSVYFRNRHRKSLPRRRFRERYRNREAHRLEGFRAHPQVRSSQCTSRGETQPQAEPNGSRGSTQGRHRHPTRQPTSRS